MYSCTIMIIMHTFIDGPFMVVLAQPVYVAQESDSEVSVCVTAVSSTAMLSANIAVIVRTESGTATKSGTVCIMSLIIYCPQAHSRHPIPSFSNLVVCLTMYYYTLVVTMHTWQKLNKLTLYN